MNYKKGEYNWHLNNTLLKDKTFCSYLAGKIDLFLSTNDMGDVDDSTLWEDMKAVMRDHIISYEAAEKKNSKRRLTEIDDQLSNLENEYKIMCKPELINKITILRYEYNSILSKNISKLLIQVKQKYFELSDKPHRLLAHQLKQSQASKAVLCIKSNNNVSLMDPEKINKHFADFYA